MKVGNWTVSASQCGQYLYVTREGDSNQVHIKAESEGLVVDIWDQAGTELLDSCCAEKGND